LPWHAVVAALAVCAATAGILSLTIAPAEAGPCLTGRDPFVTLLVGDSYSSGEGGGGYGINPRFGKDQVHVDDPRHQSENAAAYTAWAALQKAKGVKGWWLEIRGETVWRGEGPPDDCADWFIFRAVSGAKVEHLTSSQKDEDYEGAIRSDAQALGVRHDVDLVLFGFGGNDLQFAKLLEAGIEAGFKAEAHNLAVAIERARPGGLTLTPVDVAQAQVDALTAKIESIKSTRSTVEDALANGIRTVAELFPKAKIGVMDYPFAVKSADNAAVPFFTGRALDKIFEFNELLNQTVLAATQRAMANPTSGSRVIPVFRNYMLAGHELSAFSPGVWGVTVKTGTKARIASCVQYLATFGKVGDCSGAFFGALQESFHPNLLGQKLLSNGLREALYLQFPEFFPVPAPPDMDLGVYEPPMIGTNCNRYAVCQDVEVDAGEDHAAIMKAAVDDLCAAYQDQPSAPGFCASWVPNEPANPNDTRVPGPTGSGGGSSGGGSPSTGDGSGGPRGGGGVGTGDGGVGTGDGGGGADDDGEGACPHEGLPPGSEFDPCNWDWQDPPDHK
jgi:uncharacterized membrane protein YgcG